MTKTRTNHGSDERGTVADRWGESKPYSRFENHANAHAMDTFYRREVESIVNCGLDRVAAERMAYARTLKRFEA